MKIDIYEEIKKNTLLSHVVLNGMSDAIIKGITSKVPHETEVDIVLTVNGEEIELLPFMQHWQNQVDSMIKEEAKKLVDEKMSSLNDIQYLVIDLKERLEAEIAKRMESWEKPS